jgi:hypothetical protein
MVIKIIIMMISASKIPIRNPEEKRPLEDLDVDGGTIIKVTIMKHVFSMWTEFTWLRLRYVDELLPTR